MLNDQTFAILVLMALFTTFITTPIVTALYKPARKIASYTHRTVQRRGPDSEFRILACFHSTRNIPTMINLIESSRGTRRGRLCVYAMHLIELSERSSAISMVHKARRNGLPFWNKKRTHKDQMVIAFEAYQQLSSVSVRPMTAISPLNSIHEDVCTSAHQKQVAMILLPFHKYQRLDGVMESLGPSFHLVNQRVIRHAPCSVGILVDRGLGGTSQVSASHVSYSIAIPFFGGRDDREALAYGVRMAEHPGIKLTVINFVAPPGKSLLDWNTGDGAATVQINEITQDGKEDDDQLFFEPNFTENESISYEKRVVEGKAGIVAKLTSMTNTNLFLVGRMSAVAGLTERSDCPELGPVGSFLASSEFSTTASVLVIQQYNPTANFSALAEEEASELSDGPDDAPV